MNTNIRTLKWVFSGAFFKLFFLLFSITSIQALSQTTRTSVQSGNWTTKGTWDCNCVPAATDNAIIASGHTVTFVADNTIHGLTINDGGVISDNGRNNTISGDFIVNGTYGGYGTINLTGTNTSIGGNGTISNTASLNITGNKSILSSAELTKSSGDVNILGAFTITNYGTITIGANIIGTLSSSTWINASDATLNIGGTSTTNPLLNTGTLDASATGNTINYFGSFQYTFKLPLLVGGYNTYYNLIVSGANNKTIPNGSVAVNGDLTIYSTLNGNGSSKNLHVRGNWTNYGSFTPGAGTVHFDGTGDQIITNSSTEDFHNLIINKPSGKLLLSANVVVASNAATQANRSTLSMLSGDIEVGSSSLTLGRISPDTLTIYTGVLAHTSGKIIGPFKRFINHEWSSTRTYVINEIVFYSGSWWKSLTNSNLNNVPVEGTRWTAHTGILFPIGVAGGDRHMNIDFKNLTTGSMTVEFIEEYPGNSGLPKADGLVTIYNAFREGYWKTLTQYSLTSTDYNISLTGDGMESTFTIDSDTRVLYRPDASSDWDFKGVHGTNSGNVVSRNTIDVLAGQFALGDKNNCTAPLEKVITGLDEVCKNDSDIAYSITGGSGNNFGWTVVGGLIEGGSGLGTVESPSMLSGADLTMITVDWGSDGGIGTVSVSEGIYCAVPNITLYGPDNSLDVIIRPEIPSTITGKSNVPQNGTDAELYSITALSGYTYSWSVLGGTIQEDPPTGDNITVLWGNSGNGSVTVTNSYSDCDGTSVASLPIRIYETISSVKTGTWNIQTDNATNRSLWDCNCIPPTGANITIKNTHRVTISNSNSPNTTIGNLNIEQGGTLVTGSNSGRPLNITGDLNINGTLEGTAAAVNLNAGSSNASIYGTGLISNTSGFNFNAPRTIFSTAAISKPSGSITIASGVKVRNDGSISLNGDIIGGDATSEWVNQEGSILEIGGSLLATGTLDASENNNLIRYNGSSAQSIKVPNNDGQYANLAFSGVGNKSLSSNLLIKGNLTNDAILIPGTSTIDFNGVTAISGSVTPSFNNLIISGTLTSSSDSIEVAGDFTNSGLFNHNNGTVSFNGTGNQSIGANGADFYNLTVNKTGGGLNLSSALNLISTLTIQSSTALQSNGNLTLLSSNDSPDVTARIASLPSAATIAGDVNVQRFIAVEDRVYRYISSPVSDGVVADWQDDFAVTGNFTGRSLKDPFNNSSQICGTAIRPTSPSLYRYNETVSGLVDEGYEVYPPVGGNSSTATLEVGRGYAAFIRESCYRNVVIDITGSVNRGDVNGDIALPVSYTASTPTALPGADGWNLVGNPFPSAIDWKSPSWIKTNIANSIAIRDNGSGNMLYYDGTEGSDFDGVIALGQAFWVEATAASPALVVNENAKAAITDQSFYRLKNVPTITAFLKTSNHQDRAQLKQRDGARFDRDDYDASKLPNDVFGVSVLSVNGASLAINAVPEIREGDIIPIRIDNLSNEAVTLSFTKSGGFEEFGIELTDHFLGIKQVLDWNEVYEFNSGVNAVINENRFTARLVKYTGPELKAFRLTAYPNPVKDHLNILLPPDNLPKKVTVFDQRGIIVESFIVGGDQQIKSMSFSSKPSGVYLVRLVGSGYNLITKVIKE